MSNSVEPRFRFTTSSVSPEARVRCLKCGWTTTGRNPRKVFPKADAHVCGRGARENDPGPKEEE